jgi:hypothetical protein
MVGAGGSTFNVLLVLGKEAGRWQKPTGNPAGQGPGPGEQNFASITIVVDSSRGSDGIYGTFA